MLKQLGSIFFGLFLTFSVFAGPNPELIRKALFENISKVDEFQQVRELALSKGLDIYLFGGTAASYAHYIVWYLEKDDIPGEYRKERFDFQYENIYDDLQDFDVVVASRDGKLENIEDLSFIQDRLRRIIPGTRIDVFGLRRSWNDNFGKPRISLLNNRDFIWQHLDSDSTVLIKLNGESESDLILDLKAPDDMGAHFLSYLSSHEIHYYHSDNHDRSQRAKDGINPPILSVIRYLSKAFRYGLKISDRDRQKIKEIIDAFSARDANHSYIVSWLSHNANKLLMYVMDLEEAWNILEDLGLRSKLISLRIKEINRFLDREPLRSRPHPSAHRIKWISKPSGRTAGSLGIEFVAHETSLDAFSTMTWSAKGNIGVFISRSQGRNELARYGDGFYTRWGRRGAGAGGNGYHIVYRVDPKAREGVDFKIENGDYVIWANSNFLNLDHMDLPSDPGTLVNLFFKASYGGSKKIRGQLLERLKSSEDLRLALMDSILLDPVKKLLKLLQHWKDKGHPIVSLVMNFLVARPDGKDLLNSIFQEFIKYIQTEGLDTESRRLLRFFISQSPVFCDVLKSTAESQPEFLVVLLEDFANKPKSNLSENHENLIYKLVNHIIGQAVKVDADFDLLPNAKLVQRVVKYFVGSEHASVVLWRMEIERALGEKGAKRRKTYLDGLFGVLGRAIDLTDSEIGRSLPVGENFKLLMQRYSNVKNASDYNQLLRTRYVSNVFKAEAKNFLDQTLAEMLQRFSPSVEEIQSLTDSFLRFTDMKKHYKPLMEYAFERGSTTDEFRLILGFSERCLDLRERGELYIRYFSGFSLLSGSFADIILVSKWLSDPSKMFEFLVLKTDKIESFQEYLDLLRELRKSRDFFRDHFFNYFVYSLPKILDRNPHSIEALDAFMRETNVDLQSLDKSLILKFLQSAFEKAVSKQDIFRIFRWGGKKKPSDQLKEIYKSWARKIFSFSYSLEEVDQIYQILNDRELIRPALMTALFQDKKSPWPRYISTYRDFADDLEVRNFLRARLGRWRYLAAGLAGSLGVKGGCRLALRAIKEAILPANQPPKLSQ